MDELEISGKRYISSRRAAREHKYHSDYIGQLIRAKKVIGQKVGRSWYVDEESLAGYLRGETIISSEPTTSIGTVVVDPHYEPKLQDSSPSLTINTEKRTSVDLEVDEISTSNSNKQLTDGPLVRKIDEHKIPIQLVGQHDTARNKGLTYVSDTEPLLPEIIKYDDDVQNNFHISPHIVHESSSRQVDTEKRSNIGSVISLISLGLLTFITLSVSAYILNYTTIVESNNLTTSISFGYW